MKKLLVKIFAMVLAMVLTLTPVILSSGQQNPTKTFEIEKSANTITRGEFSKYLCEYFEKNSYDEACEFSDVDENSEYFKYISIAVSEGWITGFEDNTFRPDNSITFEQAITILCRASGIYGSYYEYPADYISYAIEHSFTDGINALIGESITGEQLSLMLENFNENREDELLEEDGFSFSTGLFGFSGGGSSYSKSKSESVNMMADFEAGVWEEAEIDMDDAFYGSFNTEEYVKEAENVFKNVLTSPLSTFSIDTDTASYSNLRRFILNGQKIPNGSVRSEELINYFTYTKAETEKGKPFGVNYSVGECPWNKENYLAMITVSGEELTEYKPSNLVFLIDTSGSMSDYNKLPLVKKALSMLLDKLTEKDTISIVTYASGTKVALESTKATEKEKILSAIDSLMAYGATSGASGINLAYDLAEKNKLSDGNNRIVLCTDGDFNVGISSTGDLEKLIEEKRKSGIFLSVLGFGMGNYKDNRMETLADKGNGNYAYIDNLREAKKVLVDEMSKTIYTIAKDVKIQVEFNPETVKEYRLIGYENRQLNNEDFENDKVDAGELGAGATVTVLYELVPSNGNVENKLKYQTVETNGSNELMCVKIRYKEPNGTESILSEYPVLKEYNQSIEKDFFFASAVAELGMLLSESEYKGNSTFENVIGLARQGMDEDKFGLRCEFIQLVDLLRYSSK